MRFGDILILIVEPCVWGRSPKGAVPNHSTDVPASMSLKRKIAITGGLFFLLGLLLVCLLTAAYFFLPYYLETRIIPQLASDAGLTDFAVNVRNIGFYSADLGTLRIGPRENPAFVIRSVQVDYSPHSLYQQKIDKITLSGIELHGELANGRFKLRGVDIEKILADAQRRQKTAQTVNDQSSPIIVERLEIRNSLVSIGYQDQIYRIPVEFDLDPEDPAYEVLDITARLYPRGEEITFAAKLNRPQRRAALRVDSATLQLNRFTDISVRVADLMLSGELAMHARAEVRWAPWQIASVTASLMLRVGNIAGDGFQLKTAGIGDNGLAPFRLELSSKNTNEWQIRGGGISLMVPAHMSLTGFDGTIIRNAAALESSGKFSVVLHSSTPSMPNLLPLKIQSPLPLQGRFSARYQQAGRWQCEVSNIKPQDTAANTVRLHVDPYTITLPIPEFKLSATAKSENIDAVYMLAAPGVRITSASESINLPNLQLKGTARKDNAANSSTEVRFDLRAPGTGIKIKDGEIKISDVAVSGKLNRDDIRQMTLDGVLQFAGAGGRFSRFGAQVGSARGKIPFKWPVEAKPATGSISVGSLKYNGMELGSISSQIRQTAAGFAFEGRHQNVLLPGLKLNFSGESRLFTGAPAGARVRVQLTRPADAPEIELGKFFPEAKEFRINGKVDIDGDFAMDGRGFSGKLQTDFNDGRLSSTQNKLALEGIRMSLNFPDLPQIRSAPGQEFHFSKFSLGDLVAEKGSVDFQIESTRSFLIEKMRFLWCDGNVETQAMRLSPAIEDYRITFYCDRLNLAKVLEQFGAASAEGRGTVNGRIPLHYANGKISFDDGFLFSTPGDGGKIRLTGTDILTAGVPPDTPQFVQMELASEALKDYDYTWAKLNITSQGEELLLQMQVDGKPAKTLPFVYRKDVGGFLKVEADAKGSTFQGIRLDVNFRLPLNKLLQYKNLINLMKKSN